jgi:hypothetical protein
MPEKGLQCKVREKGKAIEPKTKTTDDRRRRRENTIIVPSKTLISSKIIFFGNGYDSQHKIN